MLTQRRRRECSWSGKVAFTSGLPGRGCVPVMVDDSKSLPVPTGATRRSVLGLGVAGAGVAAVGPPGLPSAAASTLDARSDRHRRRARPDRDDPRFTVVVVPDTQYLFDDASIHPEPLAATVRWVLDNVERENIVFLAHLGDVVQNGLPREFAAAGPVFDPLDRNGLPWSVLAGNHDINSGTDDQRGPSPWLSTFGPSRFAGVRGYSASPGGYNSAHRFRAGGREWLLLAMDWRVSDTGLAWARRVLAGNPTLPVLLTIHELVYNDDRTEREPGTPELTSPAKLSDYGQHIWDALIKDHDQIFLSLNGHFWPPARVTATNTAGHDLPLHITNYQDFYYGGAAMIRLYRFDLERSRIDVSTINPWLLEQPYESLNELDRRQLELTSATDRFSVPLDPGTRFAGFDRVRPRPARDPGSVLLAGTIALWGRFGAGRDGQVLTGGLVDRSGTGNHLAVARRAGARPDALTLSAEHHPDQPSHGSVFFQGGRAAGDYLRTVTAAPLNADTLTDGFTVEAFVKLPADWSGDNAWSAALSRAGSSGEAGKTGGYSTTEPVATLSFSGSGEVQWYVYPLNLNTSVTNWSHILPLDTWRHLAVTNDGRHTTLWVDGCEVVRNPATVAHGIATVGRSWFLGGHEDGGRIDQVHYGWIGDVRITDHALRPERFMIA